MRKALSLFATNKSCAGDTVISVMLRVIDEDVLDLLAEAIEARVFNRENEKEGAHTMDEGSSIFVQFRYD